MSGAVEPIRTARPESTGLCFRLVFREADADAARVRALAAYKDFLILWKDADPDIPILQEAKGALGLERPLR